jgi:hypothetical protein
MNWKMNWKSKKEQELVSNLKKKNMHLSGEGYYLKIYPVEVKVSGIFLGIEDGGLFNWLK